MIRRSLPTRERLQRLLSYDPLTGVFTWVGKPRRGRSRVGQTAGNLRPDGYVEIGIDGTKYLAHRLAFVVMGHEEPEEVDHKNLRRRDNRWCNLRASTSSKNKLNTGRRKDNTSGHKGVSRSYHGKWRVDITVNKKHYSGGYHNSFEEAVRVYRELHTRHHGELGRLR